MSEAYSPASPACLPACHLYHVLHRKNKNRHHYSTDVSCDVSCGRFLPDAECSVTYVIVLCDIGQGNNNKRRQRRLLLLLASRLSCSFQVMWQDISVGKVTSAQASRGLDRVERRRKIHLGRLTITYQGTPRPHICPAASIGPHTRHSLLVRWRSITPEAELPPRRS